MHTKKVLVGVLALVLVLGGALAYSRAGDLQGRFSGVSTKTTTTKPDFYFSGGVTYNSGLNYFEVNVCQTNVASTDVKQTSLKFAVAGGQSATVAFTPTVTTGKTCQVVSSGDLGRTLYIFVSGSYDVITTLDTTSIQTEANESNNTATTSGVVVASPVYVYDSTNLPDLWMGDINFNAPSQTLEAHVCGLEGLLPSPSKSVAVNYEASENGTTLAMHTEATLSSPFGSSTSCQWFSIDASAWAGSVSSGTLTLSVWVDSKETTPESNEGNNRRTTTIDYVY